MATIRRNEALELALICRELSEAVERSDHEIVFKLLLGCCMEQRLEMKRLYHELFDIDLEDLLFRSFGDGFGRVLKATMAPPGHLEARILHHAMRGADTLEEILIEVLFTNSPDRIDLIKAAYLLEFDGPLEDAFRHNTSGHFSRLLTARLLHEIREDDADDELSRRQMLMLIERSDGRFDGEDALFLSLLMNHSHHQLRHMFKVYEEIAGELIEDLIRREAVGHLAEGYITMVRLIRDPHNYYAHQLHHGVRDRDEELLLRIIFSRSEVDLGDICRVYSGMYERQLKEMLLEEVAEDYVKILILVIGDEIF